MKNQIDDRGAGAAEQRCGLCRVRGHSRASCPKAPPRPPPLPPLCSHCGIRGHRRSECPSAPALPPPISARVIAPPPGADPQPIDPESELIQTDGTLAIGAVERLKRYECRRYAACLDFAAAQNWANFDCTACTAYVAPPDDDPARRIFDRVGRALATSSDVEHDEPEPDEPDKPVEPAAVAPAPVAPTPVVKRAPLRTRLALAERARARKEERRVTRNEHVRAPVAVEYVTAEGRVVEPAEAEVILAREREQIREALLARARDDHERAAILAQWQD